MIHQMSKRSNKLMITVNCAALPASLIESELFGREKGAYTGALTRQAGRFEIANHSTIFLDEIGEMPLELQVKLLRILQFGEFERIGSPETHKTNVRIIAATNKDLKKAQDEGMFRKDLYYRLNVFPIHIPPLRDRLDDVAPLVWTFVNELVEKTGKRIDTIPRKVMEKLTRYSWPGNVRELRNVIEHAMIITTSRTLDIALPTSYLMEDLKVSTLEEMERIHILAVLKQTHWRVRGEGGAAQILGLNEATLRFRMKKLGIMRPE
jgi:transcriptional regulator with GAF, ATPase, and Fis domain